MRKYALLIALVLPLAACDRGKVVQVATCAAGDETLSVAFKDPRKAVNHLGRLVDGLKVRDEEAIAGTIKVLESFISCIE